MFNKCAHRVRFSFQKGSRIFVTLEKNLFNSCCTEKSSLDYPDHVANLPGDAFKNKNNSTTVM